MSHKSMRLDAGHICQNLHLAAESFGCGARTIGGYWQERADGEHEHVVYLASVGRVSGDAGEL